MDLITSKFKKKHIKGFLDFLKNCSLIYLHSYVTSKYKKIYNQFKVYFLKWFKNRLLEDDASLL